MQQPGSITFGTPLAPATSAQTGTFSGFGGSSGLKFGASATPSIFGTPASTAASGMTFGGQTTTFGAQPQTNNFGVQPQQNTFGAQPQQNTFGTQPQTSTSGTGFSFGNTAQPSTGLFGAPAATTAATGFSFGAVTTTTTAPGLNFGTGLNLNNQFKPLTTAAPTSAPIGLGGIDTSQSKTGQPGSVVNETEGKGSKDTALPNEFIQLIDGFKNHIKQQKMYSSDVARGSLKPIRKIHEDIDALKSSLIEIGNSMGTNRQTAEKLKFDTAKCLSNAEMAQRIHDTPPGFQIDNSSSLQYFIDTVNKFECDLSSIRQQIEATEKHIKSLDRPRTLSSQEMTLGLRRLHETFVALAGRLQAIHSQVEIQKDQYLNMRKYLLKDSTNIFDKPVSNDDAISKMIAQSQLTPPKRAAGPTPFSSLNANTPYSFMNQPATIGGSITPQPAPPAYPVFGQPSLNWGNTSSVTPGPKTTAPPPSYNSSIGLNNSSLFGGTTTLATQSNDFQLQKPPTGNKRGKH